jgi:hypothetical protein
VKSLLSLVAVAALVALSACGKEGDESQTEGPLMAAGQDCLQCHGGSFTAAGTVYASSAGAQAVSGATVQLKSGATVLATLTTNAAGNFYTSAALPSSFDVVITASSQTASMGGASGHCNGCHVSGGVAGFRVHVP